MGDEISSDMPGTEEFAGMSEQELGDALPEQGAAPRGDQAGAGSAAPTGEQAGVQQAAAAVEPNPADTVKTLETKLAAVEKMLSTMTRENRGYQALKSKVAKLENALSQRAASPTTLSPEQQAEQTQRTEAEQFLKDFLGKYMADEYGQLIEPLRQQQFVSSVQQRCQEMGQDFNELNPFFYKVINDDIALAKDGDQQALDRIDRVMKGGDSNELMLRAILERSKQVQATGARVQQAQQQAAAKGGRALKPNGAKPQQQDGKNLTQADIDAMPEEEREKLPMDVLEKAVQRQRSR